MNLRRSSALLCALMVLSTFMIASPAQAACASSADLKPLLRDVTINQGLGSYRPLVNGKRTIATFLATGPGCAASNEVVELKSATLNVTSASPTVIPQNYTTPRALNRFEQATVDNGWGIGHAGNPEFPVPGSAIKAPSVTFSLSLAYEGVRYTTSGGKTTRTILSSGTATFTTFNGAAISAPVHGETLPRRVLGVPIGLTPTSSINNTPLEDQFSSEAVTATNQALDAGLGRMLPVADGRTTLGISSNQSAGLLASVLTGARALIPEAFSLGSAPNKKFCGTGEFLLAVRPKLLSFLLDYNTMQIDRATGLPSMRFPADRVMGLIDQKLWGNCAHGFAGLGTPESWVSVRYDTATLDSPEHTGSLMGLEGGHNDGAVPCGGDPACENLGLDRDFQFNPHHSQPGRADLTAPLRAYNTLLPDYLDGAVLPSENRTVMSFQSGWDDPFTLYEKPDWDLVYCKLGGPFVPECALYPHTVGTSGSDSPPGETIAISGTTDLSRSGTNVFTSYVAPGPKTPPQSGSPLTLVQSPSGKQDGVPVSNLFSIHSLQGHEGGSSSSLLFFYGEFELASGTTNFKLVDKDGEVLYERNKDLPPEIDEPIVSMPLDFDDGENISDVVESDRYTSSFGVTLTSSDPDASTLRFSGSCTPDQLIELTAELLVATGEAAPCRTGSTQSPPFSLRNNQQADQQLVGQNTSLKMTFQIPQSSVQMRVGNGAVGVNVTQATLQGLDAEGQPIEGVNSTVAVGVDVTTPIAIRSDKAIIHGARLSYSDTNSEEIDDLLFSPKVADQPGALVAHVTDDSRDVRMSWFGVCDHEVQPLESGASPVGVTGPDSRGLFRSTFVFNPILSESCIAGGRHLFRARATDGFQTDTADKTLSTPGGIASHAPEATISVPTAGTSFTQHQTISVTGSCSDRDEGTCDTLNWEVGGQTASRPTAYIAPPAGGWSIPTGQDSTTYAVTLNVEDSNGLTDSASVDVTVCLDADGDGICVEDEECAGGTDGNPLNQFDDPDLDGMWNWFDPDDCQPDPPDFRAVVVDVDPDVFNLPSSPGDLTVKFRIPFQDENRVRGNRVRISKIGAIPVPDPLNPKWFAKRTAVEGGDVFVAKFDRRPTADFLLLPEHADLQNSQVLITVVGEGLTPGGLTYVFEADDMIRVQKNK